MRKGTPGIADDWNYTISRAETPLVTIAHQDDVYCPDYSTRMLAAVNSVTDPLLFFTDYGELRDGKEVDNNTLLQAKRRLLYPLRDGRHATSRLVRRRALSLGCAICCPSVTLNLALLSTPPFSNSFKCDLDWDAWERASRLKGPFYYDSSILMYHRIHAGSETTVLIKDSTRTHEGYSMLCRFWPKPIAKAINAVYRSSQDSNG